MAKIPQEFRALYENWSDSLNLMIVFRFQGKNRNDKMCKSYRVCRLSYHFLAFE